MDVLALLLAAAAFLVAFVALGRAGGLARRLEDLETDARRRAANLAEEVERSLAETRRLLAAVAGGEELSAEQILEGRLWRGIDGEEGRRLVEEGGARLLDVRTPDETRGGVVPGALLVPVDQLEARLRELPRDGRPTIAYCAMGARSAHACELLSRAGFERLYNLEGGIGAWRGPLEKPAAS